MQRASKKEVGKLRLVRCSRLTALLWLLADKKLDYAEYEAALKQGIQDAEEATWYSSGICLKQVDKLERRDFATLAKKRVVRNFLQSFRSL